MAAICDGGNALTCWVVIAGVIAIVQVLNMKGFVTTSDFLPNSAVLKELDVAGAPVPFSGGPASGVPASAVPAWQQPIAEERQCFQSAAMDKPIYEASERVVNETLRRLRKVHTGLEYVPSNPPPSDCGKRAEFVPVKTAATDPFPTLQLAEKSLMKIERPDLLCAMREALQELERDGSLMRNSYCLVFGSCGNGDMSQVSEHSMVYFVCPSLLKHVDKFTRHGASRLFAGGGATKAQLPGKLGERGDDNVLCQLAKYIVKGMEEQVIPSFGMKPHQCVVQEFFFNRQRSGAWTNPHVHPDDFYGGIFYMDAPKGTRLCYENNVGSYQRGAWERHAPNFVTKFGEHNHSAGYAEVKAGDILLAPVNWLQHWVPPLEERNVTRTSVVFNMNCIPAPPSLTVGETLQMPALGFGTCCRSSAKGPALQRSLAWYFRAGGRLVDTAFMYGNHYDVMVAVNNSKLLPEELWITDKLLGDQMGYDEAKNAIRKSLMELNTWKIDLMLIHEPKGWQKNTDTWRAMLEAKKSGILGHVGVSNFNRQQIEELQKSSGVLPEVNQIEYSPFSPPEVHEFVRWMQKAGIAVTAYGSLGHAGNRMGIEQVEELAKKYQKTQAQILLRWALDKGVAIVPGATSEQHIEQNLDLLDFSLTLVEQTGLESVPKPESWRWFHAIPGQ